MNEADGSPGGGSPPPTPADPAAPKPESAPPQPLTLDQVNTAVAKQLETFQNGFFANARKAGLLPKEKTPEPTPKDPPKDAPAAAGLSMADVEALLERERVITARATKHNLNDAQVRRVKAGTAGTPLESFASEVDAFLADMGLVKSDQPAAPAPAPAQPSNPQPVSDKGSPAPGGVLDWEREFAENPMGMSPAARQRMDAKYGPDKARRMRLEAAKDWAERTRVTASPSR